MYANHALRQSRRPGWLQWHVAIPQGRTEKHTNTPPATVICLFTLEHQDAVIIFYLFLRSRQCRRSASLLSWVNFIYISDVTSLCDMVGMCTGMSSALCSPGLPLRSTFLKVENLWKFSAFFVRLSLNSLSVCAITVRVERNLHVNPTSEMSQT